MIPHACGRERSRARSRIDGDAETNRGGGWDFAAADQSPAGVAHAVADIGSGGHLARGGVHQSFCGACIDIVEDGGVGGDFLEPDAGSTGGRHAVVAVFEFFDLDDSQSGIICANNCKKWCARISRAVGISFCSR